MIVSPSSIENGSSIIAPNGAGKEQKRQRGERLAGPFDGDQIAGVEEAGREREHVSLQVADRQFRAAAHEQGSA